MTPLEQVNSSLKQRQEAKATPEAPSVKSAVAALQSRVVSAKRELATIKKAVAFVKGAGSAKLVSNVRELNDRFAELEKQVAALAASAQRISKINP
jgi:seryl-tRNA synthetase